MADHTPGPWSFGPQVGTPGHCFMAQVFDGCGKSLAVIDPTEDESTGTANAQVMAAALDLLRALKEILNSDMAMREEDEGSVSGVLDRARAAISKATGGHG